MLDFQYIAQHLSLIMSIKQTQKVTQSAIQHIDERIWKEIAQKAISKMPKIQLSNQSNKVFQDFALMNGQDPKSFLSHLAQQQQKKQTIFDNLLIGSLKKSTYSRKLSEGDALSISNPRKLSYNLNMRASNHLKTDGDDLLSKNKGLKPCVRLFFSQISNEQQQIIQGQLRKAKQENIRYNQRLQQITRERVSKSQQHAQSQKKKFRETKSFTYDYEGKLMGTRIKQNGNIKFVHIKSKFYQNNIKEHKKILEKLSKTKYSQITDKKVINGEDRQAIDSALEQKNNKNVYHNHQNSINDLFGDDKSIQMGVSIIDKATNSKFFSNNNEKSFGQSLKLSDFKKSFKSASMVGRKKHQKLVTIDPVTPKLSQKQFVRMKTVSDAQSKILSSAFSRYSKQIGKININNSKAFLQSLENDRQ